ncbi:hypothetical protein TVAG_199500 [Trichomonas vaginalis G3]|uniref:Dynein regulatory complex protein 10 n=1 Tax=Trichomonas vaginalis (strain ATCC PRA-98 / G3) TaxID=412133 RepID=A2DDY5_TRIV3|nr:IQ domain-containing protein D family [Trichomonas vaginalis G3]EAY21511.1 hypothetical protein TVAG_199500 [Trichomonas vaginalis G3]KAI5490727.1 IQ domain-containing protein D family [Trichomonas vaginalis G3]|eukprot:XP_001582497.1 hypothetical protein [Trichomonas vaginalis G3]
MSTNDALKVSSVGAKRILCILDECRKRVELSLLLPTIGDFIESNDEIPPIIKEYSAEFHNHKKYLMEIMTTDGYPKPGYETAFDEEVLICMELSRELSREMDNYAQLFKPIIDQRNEAVGYKPKIVQYLDEMINLETEFFSKHVKDDKKRNRIVSEIQQMENINREHIEILKQKEISAVREKELKIRAKEEELDAIKKQLVQARSMELPLLQEDKLEDELGTHEENLRSQLGDVRIKIGSAQKKDVDHEGTNRRLVRKEEEQLQNLISKYDTEMAALEEESKNSFEKMTKLEGDVAKLRCELITLNEKRAPAIADERYFTQLHIRQSKQMYDMLQSIKTLQGCVRIFLRNAPKPKKKKQKKK